MDIRVSETQKISGINSAEEFFRIEWQAEDGGTRSVCAYADLYPGGRLGFTWLWPYAFSDEGVEEVVALWTETAQKYGFIVNPLTVGQFEDFEEVLEKVVGSVENGRSASVQNAALYHTGQWGMAARVCKELNTPC